MPVKQQIDRKPHHDPLASCSAETLWTERTPNSPLPPPIFPRRTFRRPSHSEGPQVPRREGSASCAETGRGCPGAARPSPRGAALALTLARHVCAGRAAPRMAQGAGREGGRNAGREAGGSPRSPRGGRAAPHARQRGCGRPASARLGHSAAQAVAPVRAVSCEAAPRLGVTISPATQSRRKTSPSSAAVISTQGAGPGGWGRHRSAERARLTPTPPSPKRKRGPQRVTCNTDGKQGGPH